jgi:hypothetical protein
MSGSPKTQAQNSPNLTPEQAALSDVVKSTLTEINSISMMNVPGRNLNLKLYDECAGT